MRNVLKERVKFVIKLAIAAALIGLVLKSGHLKLEAIRDLFKGPAFLIGIVLIGLNLWLLNWRWYWLLRSRGFQVRLSKTFSLYLIGVFFNHALPSSVGGDVVKAFYLARHQSERQTEAVLSVLIDRVLGLYSLLVLALLGVAWDFSFVASHPEIRMMAIACAGIVVLMTVFLALGFSVRLGGYRLLRPLESILDAVFRFGQQRQAIFVSVVVSLIAQTISILFFVYIGWALGFHDVPWPAYAFCVPLGFVATALPIAPAGLGVGQVAFLFLFQAYSKGSGDLGATVITAFQITMLVWGLIGSILYVRYKKPEILTEVA
jgi:uncharacterized protein (TIRG00374 family)